MANLRGHLLRSTQRIGSLVLADIAAAYLAGSALRGLLLLVSRTSLAPVVGPALEAGALPVYELAIALVLAMTFVKGYRGGDQWKDPGRASTASGAAVVIVLFVQIWTGDVVSVLLGGVLLWVLLGLSLLAARNLMATIVSRLPLARWDHRVLEIVGDGGRSLRGELGDGYRHVTTLDGETLPADLESLEARLRRGVDTILVSGEIPPEAFGALTDLALARGCRLLAAPRSAQLVRVDSRHVTLNGHTLSDLTAPSLRASQAVVKRAVDLVGSALALALLSPLFLALWAWVKIDSPGPGLFRQERPGLRGKPFGMYKFRSMRADAEEVLRRDPALYDRFLANGCKLPEDEDPRITRSGRFLRQTSLDELPQLFNVFVGCMSLVGPRPLVGPELGHYRDRAVALLSVKPGITGTWQISGRSHIGFPARAEIDLDYVRNWSLLHDLWILVMTVPAVVLRRGAH